MKHGVLRLAPERQSIPEISLLTGFQTTQFSSRPNVRARVGELWIHGARIQTPFLFPVVNILTGPPGIERNGATHKFLKSRLIFEQRRPGLMTEVLHFTDYPFTPRNLREWFPHTGGGTPYTLSEWVQKGFEERDRDNPPPPYKPLFFLDSGGFRLLFNRDVDISEYGYSPTQESILKLQLDYGADVVASLDYPVPPALNATEAAERITKSIENAVKLMQLLYVEGKRGPTGKRPFPVLAVHGQTPEQIRTCITKLLFRLADEDLITQPFGLGIGSLVPLRLSDGHKVVTIVQSAIEVLYSGEVPASFDPSRTPIHAFGITGDMLPLLTHLGVDTFDSSSYIKSASVLDYYDPRTWNPMNFHKLEQITCGCDVCTEITSSSLKRLQEVLHGDKIVGNKERLALRVGRFLVNTKSDVYGLIASHNLNLQDKEIDKVTTAIRADNTPEHLVNFGLAHPRTHRLIELLAETDPSVASAFSHFQVALIPKSHQEINDQFKTISLKHKPEEFDIRTLSYAPPSNKDRLLLIACSQAKPYGNSKSHRSIYRFLEQHVGEALTTCHKVTISGLYGPVPVEFENEKAVLDYEYMLSTSAKQQSALVSERLVDYLVSYFDRYQRIVAYVSATAYRRVVESAFLALRDRLLKAGITESKITSKLILVPTSTHGTGTKDLLTHKHLEELVTALYPGISIQSVGQTTLGLDE